VFPATNSKSTDAVKESLRSMVGHIVVVGILILGCAIIAMMMLELRVGGDSQSWPTTQGTVRASRVREVWMIGRPIEYELVIDYEYTVDGATLRGDTVRFGDQHYAVESDAEKELANYPTGSNVTVYYDPRRPRRSVLQPGVRNRWQFVLGIVAGAILVAISLLFLLL
jgi:hypothetical protein